MDFSFRVSRTVDTRLIVKKDYPLKYGGFNLGQFFTPQVMASTVIHALRITDLAVTLDLGHPQHWFLI